MLRTDIINHLINEFDLNIYLEIGLDNPEGNFNNVKCQFKHSVDPFFESDHVKNYDMSPDKFSKAMEKLTFRMISDEFFNTTSMKYDLIFVDGLHTERQAGKDIINALKHLNPGGFVVVHDCLPESEGAQKVPRTQSEWNGDVWKCIPELGKQFVDYATVDCNYGCCVIPYTPDHWTLHYLEKSTYTWKDFKERRDELMHVVSPEDFEKNFKKKD